MVDSGPEGFLSIVRGEQAADAAPDTPDDAAPADAAPG